MSQRTYHDPLHGAIRLDRQIPAEALVIDLIDTAPFQRLRRIRQLGPAFLTFHGAESSRFTHSLGVLHLARLAMQQLETLHPELGQHRAGLYTAALLHDLGHAPLSPTGEEMFGLRHEVWSGRLVRDHQALSARLEAQAPGLADEVATLLERGEHPSPVISALVSSQLDCDRLDYLLRDSYSTGTSYGQLDLERILAAFTLAPDGCLALHPKGLMAVEHYLVVRQLMYRSVYNHRLNVVCNWLLSQAIATARRLGPSLVWADSTMAQWLWDLDNLSLDAFLANDDIRCGYHLMRWREEAPEDLAEPCRRLLDRQLLKATDVSGLDPANRLELLAEARRLSHRAGLVAERCCGLQQCQNRGYHPYKGGLRLWDGARLQALEQRSELVRTLASPVESAWLIHPAEVSEPLRTGLRDRWGRQGPVGSPGLGEPGDRTA
jgi:HD superfamily phosphohydrolase